MKSMGHRRAVDAIAGWIVGGERPPESPLPTEPEICARLSLSRTTVREAIKTLSAKGLLTTGPRVGARVLAPEHWNLFDSDVIGWRLQAGVDRTFVRDAIELRLAIEPGAAAMAATRADDADIAALDVALARMQAGIEQRPADLDEWLAGDFAFHKTVLAATHNQFFRGLLPLVEAVLRVSFRFSVTSADVAKGSLPMHRDVRNAIQDRDGGRAEARLRDIIEGASRDIDAATAQRRGGASRKRTFKMGETG